MFHHQKSSKSSDQNLEINLLQTKERESRINMIRPNHNPIRLNRLIRSSANLPSTPSTLHQNLAQPALNKPQNPAVYNKPIQDEYQQYPQPIDQIDFSQSILTSPNQNNAIVGAILFVLLIVITPTQTVMLCGSAQMMEIQELLPMMVYLTLCQCIAFGVIYYFKWVQPITVLYQYLKIRPRANQSYPSLISCIAVRPYLLVPLILLLTLAWSMLYSSSLLLNQNEIHLILFYIIILPDISISLYFCDYLHKDMKTKIIFYAIIIYFVICGIAMDAAVIVLTGAVGAVLMYLSVRVGRFCVLIQYVCKICIFGVLAIIWLSQDNDQYPDGPLDINQNYPPPPQIQSSSLILLIMLTSISMIIVRCINSKILRPQLYKYFYSDFSINTGWLILPVFVGYIYNSQIDIFISVIGCALLICFGYWVQKKEEQAAMMDMEEEGSRPSDVDFKEKMIKQQKLAKNMKNIQDSTNLQNTSRGLSRVKTADFSRQPREMKQFK